MTATAATAPRVFDTAPHAAVATCLHCGDSCGGDAVLAPAGTFCCAGCEAVFTLIAAHGLTAFYTCDVSPGQSQRTISRDASRFAELDEPAARRLVDDLGGGRAAVTMQVPALHCASCVWLLERLWRFDEGVARSEVDLLRRTVRVEFRPDRTSLRAIAERLAALGYEPVIDAHRPPSGVIDARRSLYLRIGVAGFAFGNVMLFSIPRYVNGAPLDGGFQRLFDVLNVLFAVPVLLYSSAPYFRSAWSALRARAITLDVPVALGLAVLFGRSVADIGMGWGEGFLDSFSGLVFFLLIGRLCQQKAFDRIAFDRAVRSFFPLSVRVEQPDGLQMTELNAIRVGDVMRLRPHEVVPADAILLDASAAIDYAFVTGEADPSRIERGAVVHAGGRVVGRAVRLAATREVSHSRLAELWNHPVFAHAKPDWLTGVTAAFGFWFVVVALALAAAGAIAWWPDGRRAAEVATAVLIIACPCALTIAAPITLGTTMGVLGRAGCYLKRASVALNLSRIDTIVFDKTGTLTTSAAQAAALFEGLDAERWQVVRRLAAESVHPVSRAIAGREVAAGEVSDVQEVPGAGISGCVDGHRVVIGSATFMPEGTGLASRERDPSPRPEEPGVTYASVDGAIGRVRLATSGRAGVEAALRALAPGYQRWLLSGDRDTDAGRWRPLFGLHMRFRQSPEDKLAFVRDLQAAGRRVLMIGDGLNDAGALAAADVGVAVSDDTACLVPACDGVLRGDRLHTLPALLRYARWSRRVIVLCFAVSVAYNVAGLWLALAGQLTPLATAILMPVSSLTIVGLSVGLGRRGGREVLAS